MRKKKETDKLPRDSMVIYKGWVKLIKSLPEDQQLEAFYTLFNYAFDHKPIKSKSPFVKLLIETFAPQIDANYSRWENSKKGGEERKNQAKYKKDLQVTENHNDIRTQNEPKTNPNETQNEPKTNPNVYVNENVNVNANVNVPLKENKEKGEDLDFTQEVDAEFYEDATLEIDEYGNLTKKNINDGNERNQNNRRTYAAAANQTTNQFANPKARASMFTADEMRRINEDGRKIAIPSKTNTSTTNQVDNIKGTYKQD